MNKRSVGSDKEDLVTRFLEHNGVKILDRNYSTDRGEIDIVGADGDYMVFFEVKYRKSAEHGNPLEAITPGKIRRIVGASKVYLYQNHYSDNTYVRYDCIGVLEDKITWIKNAFDAF